MAGLKLEDTIPDAGADHYYLPAFRIMIEDNLDIIRKSTGTRVLALKSYHAQLYKGQFYSLLTEYKIPPFLHWIMLRVNKLTSPHEYDGALSVLIPDFKIVENLLNVFRTRYKSTA